MRTQISARGFVVSIVFIMLFTLYLPLSSAEVINGNVDIHPSNLNICNHGRTIRASITLPDAYSLESIDLTTIMWNDMIPAQGYAFNGDRLLLTFDRQAVINSLLFTDETLVIISGDYGEADTFSASTDLVFIRRGSVLNCPENVVDLPSDPIIDPIPIDDPILPNLPTTTDNTDVNPVPIDPPINPPPVVDAPPADNSSSADSPSDDTPAPSNSPPVVVGLPNDIEGPSIIDEP